MKRQLVFSCLLLLAILSAGCGSKTPEPTAVLTSPLESPLATPSPVVVATPTRSIVVELPTPAEGMATVGGGLYLDVAGEALRPMGNARIFLGDVHVSVDGESQIAGYSERTSPQTITDDNGRFVVPGVPPGTYNLVVVRHLDPVFMRDHRTGESIVFTVEAGDILDLGEIHYVATE